MSGSWTKLYRAYYLKISLSCVRAFAAEVSLNTISCTSFVLLKLVSSAVFRLQESHYSPSPLMLEFRWLLGSHFFQQCQSEYPWSQISVQSFIVCLRRNPRNGINESKEMHILNLLLHIASCPPDRLFWFTLPQMVCQSAISCVFARSGYYFSFFFLIICPFVVCLIFVAG